MGIMSLRRWPLVGLVLVSVVLGGGVDPEAEAAPAGIGEPLQDDEGFGAFLAEGGGVARGHEVGREFLGLLSRGEGEFDRGSALDLDEDLALNGARLVGVGVPLDDVEDLFPEDHLEVVSLRLEDLATEPGDHAVGVGVMPVVLRVVVVIGVGLGMFCSVGSLGVVMAGAGEE